MLGSGLITLKYWIRSTWTTVYVRLNKLLLLQQNSCPTPKQNIWYFVTKKPLLSVRFYWKFDVLKIFPSIFQCALLSKHMLGTTENSVVCWLFREWREAAGTGCASRRPAWSSRRSWSSPRIWPWRGGGEGGAQLDGGLPWRRVHTRYGKGWCWKVSKCLFKIKKIWRFFAQFRLFAKPKRNWHFKTEYKFFVPFSWK